MGELGTTFESMSLAKRQFNSFVPVQDGTDMYAAIRTYMEGSISVGTIEVGAVELKDDATTNRARILPPASMTGTMPALAVYPLGGTMSAFSSGTITSLPTVNVGTIPTVNVGTLPIVDVGTMPVVNVGTLPAVNVGTIPAVNVGTIATVNVGTNAMPTLNSGNPTYGSVAIGSTATQIIGSSVARKALLVTNDSSVSCWIGTVNTVGTASGFKMYDKDTFNITSTCDVYGVVASGVGTVYYWKEV